MISKVKNDLFDYKNRYIMQIKDGFKFSLDSLLLAEFVNIRKSDKILKTEIPVEIISKFYVSAVINVCLEYIKFPNKYET